MSRAGANLVPRAASLLVVLSLALLGFGHHALSAAARDGSLAAQLSPHDLCFSGGKAPAGQRSPDCPVCTLVKAMTLASATEPFACPLLPSASPPFSAPPSGLPQPTRAPPARGPPLLG
jgi:hypothetical protein